MFPKPGLRRLQSAPQRAGEAPRLLAGVNLKSSGGSASVTRQP